MLCCLGLKGLVERAGDRGIAVLVRETQTGFRFVMQSRAVSIEHQDWAIKLEVPKPISFNISFDIGLKYCPFCGTELKSLISDSNREDLRKLAKIHKQIDNTEF